MRKFSRKYRAAIAVPVLASMLSVTVLPHAQAQPPELAFPGPLNPGNQDLLHPGTGYLDPDTIPPRVPIETTGQDIPGLPEGVSIDKVEWISDRWANVYIKSAAMPRSPIKVQILLARDWYTQPDRSFPSIWLLDGMRARDDESGWTLSTNIANFYADKNVNLVLPVGGESSFYTDWLAEDNGKNYQWETFLTKELPAVLQKGWRSTDQQAIIGLSMGGTAAITLAERNPDLFQFVGSFSGYLDTSSYGMPQGIALAMRDAGGYDAEKMWGRPDNEQWPAHDPKLHIQKLKNTKVYVSAGNGNAGTYDQPGVIPGIPANTAAYALEVMARLTTETFLFYAEKANVDIVSKFRPSGTHDWPYWQFENTQAWPYLADALNISKEDRGAACTVRGAIGQRSQSFSNLGSCTTEEYDGPRDGKIQDFRGGRGYWNIATDAHFLWGRIGARYSEMRGPESWLGYPTSEEFRAPDGRGAYANFENGGIYWHPDTGPFAVKKDIRQLWGTLGYEQGVLGYPVSQEIEINGGGWQKFQNGVITRSPEGKLTLLQGEIALRYMEMGGPNSVLGFPEHGELNAEGGKYAKFSGGYIFWSPNTGAHFIKKSDIFDAWVADGAERSRWGFPVKDHADIPAGGEIVEFQGGPIRQVYGRIEK